MKYLKLYFLVLAALLSGCSSFYQSNSLNVPFINRDGQSTLGLQLGTNGIDVQAATAVDYKFSLMGNVSYSDNATDSIAGHHSHLLVEGAIGMFGYLTTKTIYEVYAGYGRGFQQSYTRKLHPDKNYLLVKGEFNRYFLQFNTGKIRNKLEYGGSVRASLVDVFQLKSENLVRSESFLGVFLEPAMVLRYNVSNLKLTTQLGFSYDVTDNFLLSNQPIIFNLGLMYKFR